MSTRKGKYEWVWYVLVNTTIYAQTELLACILLDIAILSRIYYDAKYRFNNERLKKEKYYILIYALTIIYAIIKTYMIITTKVIK